MKKVLAAITVSALPILALAQTGAAQINVGYVKSGLDQFKTLLNVVVAILVGCAVIYFIFNVIKYMVTKEGDKAAAASGMLFGIISYRLFS